MDELAKTMVHNHANVIRVMGVNAYGTPYWMFLYRMHPAMFSNKTMLSPI
jgi:hypothetical protein